MASRRLMPKMSHPGEDHRQSEAIGSFDDLLVTHRATRLNDGGGANFGDFLDAVGEREEGVGGCDRAFQRQLRLHRSQLAGIDPAHLPRAYADSLAVASV